MPPSQKRARAAATPVGRPPTEKIKNPKWNLKNRITNFLTPFLLALLLLRLFAFPPASRENTSDLLGATMPRDLLLALDQGTTSSRAILFDARGNQLASAQEELRQIFPKPGWVEHDPMDIWQTQLTTAQQALANSNRPAADVAAIGITNQRETTLLWDKRTGRPLANAIVWQDRRTADFCHALKSTHADVIQNKTGLIPDAYFSASKIRWLLDNLPDARRRAENNQLAFGTVDSWLLYQLTGAQNGGIHATDISNASRTMLLNIHTGDWDNDLLALFNIPRQILPQIRPSAGPFGQTTLFGPPSNPIPITGIAGDQQAALFGQNCLSPGLAKNTYGTGCFMLMNIGQIAPISTHQLLTTIAWQLEPKSKITYALEGSVFVGGAVVQWLRDGLGIIKSAAEIESLAKSVPDSGGVYLVPAFAGLGAPHWDQYARGTIAGITRGTTSAHIARAALESIAFQVSDLLDVMRADTTAPIQELRVDGGAASNNLLLQFQADLLRVPVIRPKITETTALGAAFLAGLGCGLIKSPADLAPLWKADAEFHPKMSADEATHRKTRWAAALERSRDWEEPAG